MRDSISTVAGGHLLARGWIPILGFLAIIAFLRTTEHRAHVLGALPFLLLLACPLLHFLHHGGHGHGDDGSDAAGPHRHGAGRHPSESGGSQP